MSTDELDLAAIRARSERVGRLDGRHDRLWIDAAEASLDDVPDLLAEVERLRGGIVYIVDRYGNARGIETCATMYDLRRLAEETP